MRPASVGADPDGRQEVGVVGMEHRAIADRTGQVRGDAAARGLTYDAELGDDLITGSWTNTGFEVIDGTFSGNYRTVTNRVPTAEKDAQFLKLTVEYQ